MKTVVGFLDTYNEAEDLVDDLVDAGFDRSSIDMVDNESDVKGTKAKGKKSGGFFQSLKKLFGVHSDIPEEHKGYYAEGVRRGGVVVSIMVADDEVERASDIMDDHGAVDIEERAAAWKKTGWTAFDEKAAAYTPEQIAQERKETVLPITEEAVKVGKREVSKGGVRVYSRVIETPVEEKVSLREQHAKVSRRSVDRPVAAGEEAFKESSVEIRETAEEPVVSKEARVKEEVVVGKEASERTETIRETARRTEVSVEGEKDFRTHFQSKYGSLGDKYETYEPAYRFAGTLSSDKRYMNKDWSVIENDVRSDWEKKNPGTWDKFKGAIRYGWERVKHPTRKAV